MRLLSKSKILAHQQCPKRLWLQTFRPELAVEDPAAASRMATGHAVGEIARGLYPEGILINGASLSEALHDTQAALRSGKPVFEATFRHQDVLVRADILLPEGDKFRLVEVKSSAGIKAQHAGDVTIQTWVIANAGVSLARTEVACIDTGFTYQGNGDYHGLFKHVDLTQAVQEKIWAAPQWAKEAGSTLQGSMPNVQPGDQCNDPYLCPFFDHCNPLSDEAGFPIETLYRGDKLAPILRAEGFEDLRDVPEDRLTSIIHRRMVRCAKSGRPELDKAVGKGLSSLPYPRFYMDFETLQTAIPVWRNTHPYAQIPFQWSCHIETAPGNLRHEAFLAEGTGDPRRAFAESLVAAISESGPVFVFNAAFERSRLLEVAEQFADLREQLIAISESLVDLYPMARNNYYHPAMHGSWSLKAILPTIAAELAYDELQVRNGGMAQEAYAEMIHPGTEENRRIELRTALLTYCERDTLALVRLAHFFRNGITNAGE